MDPSSRAASGQAEPPNTREILDSIQDVMYTLDSDWRFRYVNQPAADQWGMNSNDLIGKHILEVFSQAKDTYPFRKLQEAMQQRQAIHFETISTVSGSWIDVHAYPSADGGLVVFFRDINARKKAEEALHLSEERFNKAFGASPFGLTISHRDNGLIEEVNESFEQITGYPRTELIGKTSLEVGLFVNPAEREQVVQALRSQEGNIQAEVDIRTKAGAIRKAHLSVVPLTTGQGNYMLTLIQDITEQRQMEAETQVQATQIELQRWLLEEREKERIRIARDLHDGPIQELTASTFALETLAIDHPDPSLQAELRSIRQSLQNQISELRSFTGELRPPAIAKFGLEKAIRDHLAASMEKHPEFSVHIRADQETGEVPEEIRLALFRIYQEAITNILKHSHATDVLVCLKQRRHGVQLDVVDNGEGFSIPSDWLTLARSGHLGLVGMRERVDVIGGTLTISSTPQRGTHLHVEVPL